MKLENSFEVPAPPTEAWAVLVDVERVAPCVPGAALTEALGDDAYKGTVRVKLGPVSLSFDGEARFVERDDAAHRARIKADGREAKGRGGAAAEVDFALAENAGGSTVTISTDLMLNGPVAQYGRSQGIIQSVAEEMVAQFADCLRAKVLQGDGGAAASTIDAAASGAPAKQEAAAASGFGILFGALARWFKSLFGGGR